MRLRDTEGQERGHSSAVSPSKGVTLGHSPCLPLVSALNGDHVRTDMTPVCRDGIQGNGRLRIPLTAHWELVGRGVPHTGLKAPTHS